MKKEFDVFISHASEDKYIARLLRGYLRAHNIHAWLDQDQFETTITMSEASLRDRIVPAIRNSRFFISLLSEHSGGKKWPKEECETAIAMRDAGEDVAMVALCVDNESFDHPPEWAADLHRINLRREDGLNDPLERLREDIGRTKATYIAKVKPGFLKQIPMKEVDDVLEVCTDGALHMMFVDGGTSLQQIVFPTVEKLFEEKKLERVSCHLLLMDSKLLQDPSFLSGDTTFQKRLDTLVNASEIRARRGEQHALVAEAAALFAERAAKYPGLAYEIKLSDRLPFGRYIFTGDVGFFAPFVGTPSNTSPVFIFDEKSPFYASARRNFETVYTEARLFASGGPSS